MQGVFSGMVGRGGRREGAGRKSVRGRRSVSHQKRPRFKKGALDVTVRRGEGLPSMRTAAVRQVVFRVMEESAGRFGMGVVHFSILGNHLHLIVEASDQVALSKGMAGFQVRLARALNRLWGRSGRVWSGRYFAQLLRGPRVMRNALLYVLNNARRHGVRMGREVIDPYSSARWFSGWMEGDLSLVAPSRSPVVEPRYWLLQQGWWRAGLISMYAVPGTGRSSPRG